MKLGWQQGLQPSPTLANGAFSHLVTVQVTGGSCQRGRKHSASTSRPKFATRAIFANLYTGRAAQPQTPSPNTNKGIKLVQPYVVLYLYSAHSIGWSTPLSLLVRHNRHWQTPLGLKCSMRLLLVCTFHELMMLALPVGGECLGRSYSPTSPA